MHGPSSPLRAEFQCDIMVCIGLQDRLAIINQTEPAKALFYKCRLQHEPVFFMLHVLKSYSDTSKEGIFPLQMVYNLSC